MNPDRHTSQPAGHQRSALREVLTYLGLVYALTTAIAVALPSAHINLLLAVMVPTVSVTTLTFTLFKRGSRRELWRGIGLRRGGLRSWLPALVLPVALCGAAYGTALLVGAGHLANLHITGATAANWAINLMINTVILTVIILGEEIGWRGFMLPRVQELTTKRRAAVLTGFAHGLFHLPLILIATTYDTGGSRWIAAPAAVVTITAAGVFYAWLRDRSGSIWPVAVAHNIANTVFDMGAAAVVTTTPVSLAYVAGETGFATMGACAVLAAVLLLRSRTWQQPAATAFEAVAGVNSSLPALARR
jgi:membrane protease YdiL (CAAX protease family)